MKIEVVDTFEGFLALERVWNGLLEKSQSEHVCLTFEWMQCWWSAFGEGKELFILVVKDADGAAIGIAPLMRERKKHMGVRVRTIRFIYNDNASRADCIIAGCREEVLDIIFGYLRSHARSWDILELENISEDSPNFPCLDAARKRKGWAMLLKEGLHSPYIPIDTDWETYFSGRSQKLRKTLKNQRNRLEKSGGFAIEKVTQPGKNPGILALMSAISSRSWKSKYKCDISHCKENELFFGALNESMGSRGWLDIWLMRLEGNAVAYEYALRYKDKVYALRADFDQEYQHFSPGAILHLNLVRHYFESRAKECDLCGHDDDYKKRWTGMVRKHYTAVIYGATLKGKILYLAQARIAYPAAQYLKQYAGLRKFKRMLYGQKVPS